MSLKSLLLIPAAYLGYKLSSHYYLQSKVHNIIDIAPGGSFPPGYLPDWVTAPLEKNDQLFENS